MPDFIKKKYALAEPGNGVTMFNMEGGEINLFGSHTIIKSSEFDFYSPIEDFLTQKLVEEKADTMYNIGVGVTITLSVIAGAAIFCAVTVATGGTALVLGGIGVASTFATIKAGDYTCNTLASDKETGYDRSWQEFYQDLNKNVVEGAVTGALIYAGIFLFIDSAAMSASLMESFLNAGPVLAEVGAIGQEAAITAIPNLDALASAASIAALYEATQLGKGGERQGDKEGVHFEEGEGDKASKRESEADVPDYKKENRVPLDKETVLKGKEYQKTGKKVKGAQVYKKGNQYYYRDTFHTGESAHLEVFDKRGYHLGEADPLTGALRPGTADATKAINIK